MPTALVLGSTGLVGNELVKLLAQDARFDRVIALARRPHPLQGGKVTTQLLDFDQLDGWQLAGDVLFSALGTTAKRAGSNEAQYKVDYTAQYTAAQAAAKGGVTTYALISSMGASETASGFYLRTKGELDRDVQKLPFQKIRILRPGMFDGEREGDSRPGEKIGGAFLKIVGAIPGLGGLKPITPDKVARALLAAVTDETPGAKIYTAAEVHALAAA